MENRRKLKTLTTYNAVETVIDLTKSSTRNTWEALSKPTSKKVEAQQTETPTLTFDFAEGPDLVAKWWVEI